MRKSNVILASLLIVCIIVNIFAFVKVDKMSKRVEHLSALIQEETTEESEQTSKKEHNNSTYDDYLVFLEAYCYDIFATNKTGYSTE